jgi:hypothetical protein
MKKISPKIPWSDDWTRAVDSLLENTLGPHSKEELRSLAAEAAIAGDADKLGRLIDPVSCELRRERLLQILSSPRHLQKVAEKAKRHAAIVASLPVFDPESEL